MEVGKHLGGLNVTIIAYPLPRPRFYLPLYRCFFQDHSDVSHAGDCSILGKLINPNAREATATVACSSYMPTKKD